MRLSDAVHSVFIALIAPAVISTILLYLYPAVQNCHFPQPPQHGVAPFRLLALGDPQLEGDSSLPDPSAPLFPSLVGLSHRLSIEATAARPAILARAAKGCVTRDIPRLLKAQRKKLDLLGNDYYLAHIYRTTQWWTQPTHVSVLGDLLGSQWISDKEFERRADRFWNRVFVGAHFWKHSTENKEADTYEWEFEDTLNASQTPALLNVAGNHDIGYAGDINERRIQRFERAFGNVNWRLSLPHAQSTLHIVNLNSMNLDMPAWSQELHNLTRIYLDQVIDDTKSRNPQDGVILLTHVPFYKPAGICVDGPFFDYFEPHHGGGIREQNHLSQGISELILNGLFHSADGDARAGVVVNGHDHEGCDTWHARPEDIDQENWDQSKYSTKADDYNHGVREITVRSMMGAYGGNAGLLSAWFDTDAASWKFEYDTCVLGVQHIWWAVHIVDLIVSGLAIADIILHLSSRILSPRIIVDKEKKQK